MSVSPISAEIVKRLQGSAAHLKMIGSHSLAKEMDEAADVIERQSRELAELRKALGQITSMGSNTEPWPVEVEMRKIARAALSR